MIKLRILRKRVEVGAKLSFSYKEKKLKSIPEVEIVEVLQYRPLEMEATPEGYRQYDWIDVPVVEEL